MISGLEKFDADRLRSIIQQVNVYAEDKIEIFFVFYLTRAEAQRCNLEPESFKNIMNNWRLKVFFTDEKQKISGLSYFFSDDEVKESLYAMSLWSQFRCNNDDGYLTWVDQILEIEGAPSDPVSIKDLDYNVELIKNQERLKEVINEDDIIAVTGQYVLNKDQNENTTIKELVKNGSIKEYNGATDFYTNRNNFDNGMKSIGGIYGIHGLEDENVLVIIGEDLTYDKDDKKISICKRKSKLNLLNLVEDETGFRFENEKNITSEEMLEITKNIYRVLLTRGMKKCFIYCADKKLREHMETLFSSVSSGFDREQNIYDTKSLDSDNRMDPFLENCVSEGKKYMLAYPNDAEMVFQENMRISEFTGAMNKYYKDRFEEESPLKYQLSKCILPWFINNNSNVPILTDIINTYKLL